MPNVDELFPEQPKSVDDLFPVEVEKDRYRRQTLGTSPIQDLIFGDTTVNPVARVLDHFRQGAAQTWGATDATRLSKESEDYLKVNKQFDAWNEGQGSLMKAANESLFRPAAVQLVKEMHDAEALYRGVGAVFHGTQEAASQIGTELSGGAIDTGLKKVGLGGTEQLGHDVAGAIEALPTGFRQPAGIPHAQIHPALAEARNLQAEIERARSLGVIGAGEAGYMGTRPAEVAPPISGDNTGPRRIVVDEPASVEPAPMATPEPGLSEAATVPATGAASKEGNVYQVTGGIGRDDGEVFSVRLLRDGDGKVLALDVPGEGIIKVPPVARDLATEELITRTLGAHNTEGTFIGPSKVEAASEPALAPAVEFAGKPVDEGHPIAQDVARRLEHAGRPAEEASAAGQVVASHYETRAARFGGGLGTAEEMYKAEGARIRGPNGEAPEPIPPPERKIIMPGAEGVTERPNQSLLDFLAREGGLKPTADLKQIFGDENPLIPGAGRLFRKDGLTMDEALTRAKENSFVLDPNDIQHAPGAANERPNAIRWQDLQDMIAEEAAGKKQYRNTRTTEPAKIDRDEEFRHISDALHREVEASGGDPHEIDPVTERRVVEMVQKGEAPDVMTAYERAIMEVEYNQITRGKFRTVPGGKPIITLFKDANASTFIHETGHHWLEELMKDSEHPKAPEGLRADADAVLKWLKVDTYHDIKVRHHEQFARGFERYMMEGKAPSQGLARVFAAFKDWLSRIYQTVDRLKSPINDEIRGVFDRLLTIRKEDVKIEPEGPPKTFADIHEADALSTSPDAAHPVAETIQAERDMLANEHIPEEHDARLEGIAAEAGRRETGGPQPLRDGNEAPRPEEAGNNQASGAVGEGGSNAPSEGARPSVGGGKTEAPVGSQERFTGPESALVDKAGNIRIDNLGTGEDVSKAIRDAAEQNNGFIEARRGVITDGQVLELADALGMDESKLSARKLGQAFNAEQIMAARKLLIQSATNVRDAMAKAAQGAEADILAYAETKARHQMIQEQVAGLTAEAGRALRAFRKLEGQQEAGQIDAFLKDATGKTLFQLQREAQLGMQLATPADVSKFVNDSSKPTWKDMVIEAWISALLSGPKTHVANIMGNTISGLARPIETTIAAGIGKIRNLVTGTEDRVLLGEAKAELFGMVQGAREGVVAAAKAFKTEEPQLTPVNQTERGHVKALPSATVNVFGREMEIGGKQARIPLRLLGAEDEVFKAITFRGDINRQAYAIAAKENLPPEQFNMRVAELSRSPTDEMVNKAKDAAEYQTFQTPLGKVGRSVQNFANSHILAKFVMPFVRTPINLLKYAGERTPLGLFSESVRDNLSGKNGAVARDTQISRIALGTMVGIATYELASQGLITGGGPADKSKKALMQADGWQDYSIRVGDMYYRYNRLDPFSVILGVVADAYEIYNASGSTHPDKEKIPSMVFAAVTQNILNRASLQGVSDLIQAVTDHERYGRNYLKKMAGTVVPAISSQSAQALDPVVREARTVLDGIKARIPGLSQTLLPKRDVWGEPITREGGLGPDIASPIVEARMKNDPVNKALLDAGYYPGHLNRKIRGVELTDEQYDDYQRVAGRTAKVRLNAAVNMISNPNIPASVRHDAIKSIIEGSRETAQSLVIMQSVNGENNIMKKAADAKRLKLQGDTVH